MSDIKKWLKLMENVHPVVATPPIGKKFTKDTVVILGPQVGGGTGRFVEFTDNGSALIDIKGVIKELSMSEFAIPERDLRNGNDWFHMSILPDTPGTQNDKPEFRPGDMVKIADVYGSVIGPGFGVFIGYGTTGEDCIILFDGEQIVVPVKNVASVLEQEAKDNFDEVDNDGNLSPMSYGSENVKIEQEPAMDHRDEFTKWIGAVEEALASENQSVVNNLPTDVGICDCGSWDCPICFPDQNAVPNHCIVCGHTLDNDHNHNNIVGLEEIDTDIGEIDDLMQSPMEEKNQNFIQSPRSSDSRGVKLGDIVQKTEYKPVGQESPLTHGSTLDEASYEDDDDDDFSDLGHYEPRQHNMSDYSLDDPVGYKVFQDEMRDGPKTPQDVEDAMTMISTITHIQSNGNSKASRDYSEEEMSDMLLPQLRKVYAEVTGNNGVINMENIDPDVAAMIETLKKFDKLVAENKKPDFLDVDKDGDKKEPWKKAEKDKEDSNTEEVKESSNVDPEILEWMKRFDKLGKL